MEMESSAQERVALVAGITGIVGLKLAELMLAQGNDRPSWRLYGVARRPKPSWFQHHSATYIQCDLLDTEQTLATLAPLRTHITHLFFTTWTERGSEEDNVAANADMLRNTLGALLAQPHSALQHVCLQTGSKHYLGSYGAIMSRTPNSSMSICIFDEDMPRLPDPNFYYAQEDVLFEAVARRASTASPLTWSVHRASIILGVPQVWDGPLEAADSRLIAEQEIWAATHPVAHNQAFNVSNGDDIRWRDIWPAVASFFDLQAAPYKGDSQSLVQVMQRKAHVWDRVVAKHKLLPTTWDYIMIGMEGIDFTTCKLPPYRLNVAKSAQLGFVGSDAGTIASLLANFRTMQTMGLIPQ